MADDQAAAASQGGDNNGGGIYIGCSGYSYDYWHKGVFYPLDVKQVGRRKKWL